MKITREKFISNVLKGIFRKNDIILDLGAGYCKVAQQLADDYKINITCLDIDDYNKTDLKLILYDGKKIPFKDNHFNKTILIFVLHHSQDPEKLLNEAKRVTKENIIILEDSYSNFFEYIFTIIADFFINIKHINIFHAEHHYSDKKWKELFKKLNLNIQKDVSFKRQNFPIGKHILYILKK